jgi:hypothetical protein
MENGKFVGLFPGDRKHNLPLEYTSRLGKPYATLVADKLS